MFPFQYYGYTLPYNHIDIVTRKTMSKHMITRVMYKINNIIMPKMDFFVYYVAIKKKGMTSTLTRLATSSNVFPPNIHMHGCR